MTASGSLSAYFKFAVKIEVSQLALRAHSESDQPQPELRHWQVRARVLSRGTVTTQALSWHDFDTQSSSQSAASGSELFFKYEAAFAELRKSEPATQASSEENLTQCQCHSGCDDGTE